MPTQPIAAPAASFPNASAITQLRRAGWSVVEMGSVDAAGRMVTVVRGSKGGNLLRAEGLSPEEAWGKALDQARSLGLP